MSAEQRVDDLIISIINNTQGEDNRMFPIMGIVAYDGDGTQMFGRTAAVPDMPEEALELVVASLIWDYQEMMEISDEQTQELLADIEIKARYAYDQERQRLARENAASLTGVDNLATYFHDTASALSDKLKRVSPTVKPVIGAIWEDEATGGFTTAITGSRIEPQEWVALLTTFMAPVVREGEIRLDELRDIFDEAYGALLQEAKKPKPLLS